MTTKDFDAMLAEQGPRPTFRVAGQEFPLRRKLPYAKWVKLLARMRDENVTDEEQSREFFQTVLPRADRDRFLALLEREEDDDEDTGVIGLNQLNAITDWAMEYFTGKLGQNSNSSSGGSPDTGPPPNVVSSSSKQPANAS